MFFIGATNVPLNVLDPALTRAGRMGRQVQFRIPNKVDRIDVLDFYLAKVAHTPDLDSTKRRDELARMTGGLLAGEDRAGLLDRADGGPPRRARRRSTATTS